MKLKAPKRSSPVIVLAVLTVAFVGGYVFGFTPATLVGQGGAAISDLFAPVRNFRNHRIQRGELRTELQRLAEYQSFYFEANGDFAELASIPDVADDMGFIISWRKRQTPGRMSQTRDPRWIAEAHWEDGPRGDVCAVALNLEPAYAGGIPLKRAGVVRCTWDLATRLNRGCLVRGADYERVEPDPPAPDAHLRDPEIEWVQEQWRGWFGPVKLDTLGSEPWLTVHNEIHGLVLPRDAYRLMDETYAPYHSLLTGFYSSPAYDGYQTAFSEHQAMFAVVGDFNADGLQDVVGDYTIGAYLGRVVLLSSDTGYGLEELYRRRFADGELTASAGTQYLKHAPPGTYETPYLDGGAVELVTDGFIVEMFNGPATLHYHVDGQWMTALLSD